MQTRRFPALRSAQLLIAPLLLIGCAFSVSDERAARQVDVASVDLDAESGVLRIKRDDGSSSVVYVDRPNRPGFGLVGPQPDGYYYVIYRPNGNELNRTGSTDIEFTIYDRTGQKQGRTLLIRSQHDDCEMGVAGIGAIADPQHVRPLSFLINRHELDRTIAAASI